jgi:hypothetical protein
LLTIGIGGRSLAILADPVHSNALSGPQNHILLDLHFGSLV